MLIRLELMLEKQRKLTIYYLIISRKMKVFLLQNKKSDLKTALKFAFIIRLNYLYSIKIKKMIIKWHFKLLFLFLFYPLFMCK